MDQTISQPAQPVRLPWAATGAALVSFAALAVTGGVTPALPLLSLGLLATYVFRARIGPGDWGVHWVLRLILYSAVMLLNAQKPSEGLADSILVGPAMDALGQMMAAEVVIQAWRRQPSRPPATVSIILLSGLTLLAACQVLQAPYPRLFVPCYMFFLLLSLAPAGQRYSWPRLAAVALAVAVGIGTYSAVWYGRMTLTDWGSRYLDGHPAPELTGLSASPMLGETFGLRGSDQRVLRLFGLTGITYLQGATFETYQDGRWGPDVDSRPYLPAVLDPAAPGTRARVIPLASTDGLLLIPLNSAGVETEANPAPQWSSVMGGPVRVMTTQPSAYDIIQSADPVHQGPLAVPLSPEERAKCLSLPADLDPRIPTLAWGIVGAKRDPQHCIRAITDYLMQHHRYSLRFDPGSGDPVARFLLTMPPAAAHCEYFAASAALLLRCVGVPTRYVIGYYAHESDGPGVTVVRQRDAHAWADAWVSGTGWVTVDATPPDGRPEGTFRTVPVWQRILEWLSDEGAALHLWVLSWNWAQVGGSAGGVILIVLLVQGLWRRHRQASADQPSASYSGPDANLKEMAERFSALLARRGMPCPPTRPWQEHLMQEGRQLSAAREFVRVYNQQRFGMPPEGEATRLPGLLDKMEQEIEAERQRSGDER